MDELAAGERGLESLLRALPHALVAAIGDDGLFIEPPASLPFEGRTVVDAWAATEIVDPSSHRQVIAAWDAARRDGGAGRVEVLLAGAEHPATMHLLDERAGHGVYVMVLDAGDDPPPVGPLFRPVAAGAAKVVRVRKDIVAMMLAVDDTVTEILGWQPDELVDRRSLELVHPDDQNTAIAAWMDMLASPGLTTRARLRHARGDGGWTWLDISNTNHLEGDDPHVDCEMVDVSEEVAALDALHASEQLLRRLTDTLPVGVFHIDLHRRVRLANPKLHEILGTTPRTSFEEALRLVVDHLSLERAVDAVLDGKDVDTEFAVRRNEGSPGVRRCTLELRPLEVDGEITGAVGCVTDVTDSVRLQEELRRRATTDELTGCLNRASALEAVRTALAGPADVAVVFVDIDEFKAVNDGHGHAAGDSLLRAVGGRLRAAVRLHDAVGRMGGDEFLALCTGLGSEQAAEELAGRITSALGTPIGFRDQRLRATASVGVAWVPPVADVDAEGLVARADAAMYAVKSARS